MKNKWKTLSFFGALTLGIVIAGSIFQGGKNSVLAATSNAKNFYTSDYESREELIEDGKKLTEEIFEEGFVLLKNDDNVLPIDGNSKISVFGKNSNKTEHRITSSLQLSGFQVNPVLKNFYDDNSLSGNGRGTAPTNGSISAGYNTGETPVANYTNDVISSFTQYNDVAIVVIYRISGEGNDAPRTMMWDGQQYANWTSSSTQLVPGARNKDDHYLQLDQNETDLLKLCNDNFSKVVVLLETPSSFECGFLDDKGHYAYQENIKGALYLGKPVNIDDANWIPQPSKALGRILKGEVNPSGHLVDTWARDFKLDPTWSNFGNNLMEGDYSTKGNQYANLPAASSASYRNNYVTYNEGIYSGYRYYETRGYVEGEDAYSSFIDLENEIHGTSTTDWLSWYNAHVIYPYGYGLSYTTFTQEIVGTTPMASSELNENSIIKVNVKVTNTGLKSGKEVVQLYFTTPYYDGEIEKAHVLLGDFDKTKILSPGESQILTLQLTARSMASYDYNDANKNGFKGYELDNGLYQIKLMKNAHTAIQTVTYKINENIQYPKDDVTGNDITNRFDTVSNYITGELKETYLSRSDFKGTFPIMNKRLTASTEVIAGLDEWKVEDSVQKRPASKDIGQPYYSTEEIVLGAKNNIVLADLNGLGYNDPKWTKFLEQLTEEQMTALVCNGDYYGGQDIADLGIKKVGNYDGRQGIYVRGGKEKFTPIGDTICIAQSYNKELSRKIGNQIGEEALWSKGVGIGVGAWYAPSINIHRNQFAGRNAQYYGEEGLLGGKLSSEMIIGCQNKGLAAYLKHFAVNNQETNRCGLITWLNEQSMREVYLKGFEIGVKEGRTLGIMSGLNRIGTEWAGGSYALLTEILRNEWGFEGSVVTDSYLGDNSNISNADQMIRAGGNLALGIASLKYNIGTTTTKSCLRNACHGLLYLMAHSNAVNSFAQGGEKAIQNFSGKVLDTAFTNTNYKTSIAYATVNRSIFPYASDSDIVYTLKSDSSLPEGLKLSHEGIITGTPETESNNHKFTVEASYGGFKTAADFTISVINKNGSIVYQINDTNLGNININREADLYVGGASIKKDGADPSSLPTVYYELANGSKLPDGLSLSADGHITGTPTKEAYLYHFSVSAKAKGYKEVSVDFTVSILYTMSIDEASLPLAKIGASYVAELPRVTSTNNAVYQLASGSTLPQGLSITSNGLITGTPSETCTEHKFKLLITADYTTPIEKEYSITVGLNYNQVVPMKGWTNEEYMEFVNTAQGSTNVTYELMESSKLPKGLTLSKDGIISGKPLESGTFHISIIASSDGKVSDVISFDIVINDSGLPGEVIVSILATGLGLFVACIVALIILIKWMRMTPAQIEALKIKKEEKAKAKQAKRSLALENKKTKIKKKGKRFIIPGSILGGLAVIMIACTIVLTTNNFLYFTVCSVLGGSEKYLKSGDPSEYQYYISDYNNKDEVYAAANNLNQKICEEGFVLLKNENNSLPLATNSNVTVFGKNSTNLVLGGSGSNAGSSASTTVTLYDSLKSANLNYNPTLKAYYESNESGSNRPDAPAMGSILTGFPICESKMPYPTNVSASYQDYNDAAIVVISRIGGEGYDLPRSMKWDGSSYTNWNGTQTIPGASHSDDHYLQLDANETAMLKEACDHFDNVIVLINSSSPMELGFLDDPTHYAYNEKIKSCLWIGSPGSSGIKALGKVLTGVVNPSGRTVDTYPRNFKNDPTWYNFSNNLSDNGNSYIVNGAERNAWFVEYREGIYFGYRYYETRAKEEGGTWYKDNVVYPFGYGLSYTTFNNVVTNLNEPVLTKDGVLHFAVEVENTGNYDGKNVIELYYSAPYTAGGIEKPHIKLGDFKKTPLITKNGGKETIIVSLNVRDMASYDYNDKNNNSFKGYELDEGEYTIYICDNAHGWDNLGTTSFNFVVPSGGFKYETDNTTNTSINNLFDDVSNHISTYLSRASKFANFNSLKGAFSQSNRNVSEDFIKELTYKLDDKGYEPWYTDVMPSQSSYAKSAKECLVQLYQLIGKDFDDPLWDSLLNQLTVKELNDLISTGNFRTLQMENIGKPLTTDADGPMGFALFMGDSAVYNTCYYASEVVLGSTWNADLAYEMGKMIGNEGLIGNEAGDKRPYSGWYAPAVNLHRNQFAGRNFEYYSEDSYISSVMASNVVKGARSKGIYTYAKHFALNEQETKRDDTGLITWANEQAMREIYFKPFESIVKEGKTTALMSAFNRIGTTWAGGSYSLLTQLLRKEWGFNGMVITDFNLKSYMNTDQMIRAGGDLNLSGGKSPTSQSTPTDVSSMRRATKNILYTVANSCAMNGYGPNVIWGYTTPKWVIWLYVIDGVLGALSILCFAGLTATKLINGKKERKRENI